MNLTDLAKIVAGRDFTRLVGEIEGQFFDAKAQPYQFDAGNDAKREFAKDVSAFANANGGYIFLGIATKPAVLQAGEEVSELRPIDKTSFDPDRHRKLLRQWLYPEPKEIEIDWVELGKGKGIGVISVPSQNERSKPFLISRTIGDKKTTEVLIGYAERRADRTEVRRIEELHLALRTGLNLERELLGRIANIELQMERFFVTKMQVETAGKREQRLNERLARLLEEDNVDLKNGRLLILTAIPRQSSELRTIFSDQPESIRRKLESPPRLRASGWDLPSMAQAEFLRGELIRVIERGRMMVDLYRDGTFILGGQIHRNFLAWSDKTDSHLHPLAVIELTVNFTRLYRLVLEDFLVPPEDIQLRVELRNMHFAGEKTKLGSGPVVNFWPVSGAKEAPADSWKKEIVLKSESYDPDRAAFLLIRELYLWFGHSDEAIPYTKDTADGKVIWADQIAELR